nr:MAG TPA: virion assembly protein [Caudoviricetes sp.]
MGWWHKVTHAITKPFKAVGHAVNKLVGGVVHGVSNIVGGLLGGTTATTTQEVAAPQIAAPAVAAPEPTQGQEEADLVSRKRKRTAKGKRALMIDSGGSAGSGGTTGTGLNL